MSRITTVRTACRGAIENGVTRCRRHVVGYGVCSEHAGKPLAAKPGLVLLKVRLNWKKVERLIREEGIVIMEKDEAVLNERHAAEAGMYRRSAEAYRRPLADSGVPVFGRDGAQHVKIDGVWNELVQAGFRVTGFHLHQKDKDVQSGTGELVVEFRDAGAEVEVPSGVQDAFDDLTYGYVHVWVNPPKPGVGVTHTVNISHREVGVAPAGSLVWDGGHWALESI